MSLCQDLLASEVCKHGLSCLLALMPWSSNKANGDWTDFCETHARQASNNLLGLYLGRLEVCVEEREKGMKNEPTLKSARQVGC